jgi:hypothetical protein
MIKKKNMTRVLIKRRGLGKELMLKKASGKLNLIYIKIIYNIYGRMPCFG